MRRSRHKLVDLSPALINEPREMTMKRKLYLISRPISSPRSFYFVWDGDRAAYAGMQRDYKQPSASIKKQICLTFPLTEDSRMPTLLCTQRIARFSTKNFNFFYKLYNVTHKLSALRKSANNLESALPKYRQINNVKILATAKTLKIENQKSCHINNSAW